MLHTPHLLLFQTITGFLPHGRRAASETETGLGRRARVRLLLGRRQQHLHICHRVIKPMQTDFALCDSGGGLSSGVWARTPPCLLLSQTGASLTS